VRGEVGKFLAGLRHPMTSSANMAKPATRARRVEISVSDTQTEKVLAPQVVAPSLRAQVVAIPFVTVAFLIIVAVLVAMVWPLQRYETAPGRADLVGSRLSIDDTQVEVYQPERGVRFVTALGTELNPLQSFMGWIDPFVNILTCEERFGDCNPTQSREVQLGAMANAKEIAAYIALAYLGFDATFQEGPAQVAGFDESVCPNDAPPQRACKVLAVGDVISSIDIGDGPIEVNVISKLSEVLKNAQPGDIATLEVIPITSDGSGALTKVEVELIESSDDPTRTLIGFSARDTRTVQLPFDVNFDTDQIGGPSAGLSFVLALIDALTKGELVPPQGVAVTGTIQDDGTVGAIGALVQKAVAVKKSGVKVFLVPAAQGPDEISAAQAAVGDTIKIVPVADLDEALAALETYGGDKVILPVKQG
jgi:PDZ domain-containing protein